MTKRTLVVPLQPGIATEVFRECLTEPFAREFEVVVETPARSEYFVDDVLTDVKCGKNTYDVVEWGQYDFHRAKRLELCQPIDYAALPNLADLDDKYLDGEGFGVGVFVYGMVPVYVPGLVSTPIRRWSDLWNPKLKGKIALRDQLVAGKLMAITCKALGITTEDLRSDVEYERAWSKLAELVANVGTWATSEGDIQELIAARRAGVSHQFIDVATIQKDRGVEIEVVFPEDGPIWAFRSWTVVAGSRNAELARDFINFVQGVSPQKTLAETFYGQPTNGKVSIDPLLLDKIRGKNFSPEKLTFPTWDWYFDRAGVDARWQRLRGG